MKTSTRHLLAFSLLVLLASAGPPAFGQCSQTYTCRSNGHTVALSSTSPLQGVNWPFSEDITGPTTTPVADNVVVSQAGFVRIASGCVNTNEINVAGLGTFHASFRAQTAIVSSTASSNSRFQIQLRLGLSSTDPNPIVVLDETRRLHGLYPQTDHFGVIRPNVPAGAYVYSVWAKLLTTGNITFSNTWSTAQGYPASLVNAGATTAPSDVLVNTNWTNVGPSLPLSNPAAVDVILGSHWQIVSPTTAPGLQIRYAVDGIGPSAQFGQIGVPAAAGQPEGYAAFDMLPVAGGAHTLQLQMRTTNFTATIRGATLEYVAPPSMLANPPSWPMQSSIASNTVHVSQVGSATQPMTPLMLDGCGKWTLLQEFNVAPHNGDYVWIFQVFTQFLGNLTGTARGQLAIENISYQLDANGNPYPHVAVDNAITGFQAPAGKDGMYSFGEAYRWGNGAGGNKIRLWARRISGCGSSATGGFDIGKRYVTVKLLPSDGCYPQ